MLSDVNDVFTPNCVPCHIDVFINVFRNVEMHSCPDSEILQACTVTWLLPCCAVILAGKIRESYCRMVVSDVKYCFKTILLLTVNSKSLVYFLLIIYLRLHSLHWLPFLTNFSAMVPTTDKSTVGEMTKAAGLLILGEYCNVLGIRIQASVMMSIICETFIRQGRTDINDKICRQDRNTTFWSPTFWLNCNLYTKIMVNNLYITSIKILPSTDPKG